MLTSQQGAYSAIDNASTPRQAGWCAARGRLGGFAHTIGRLGHRDSTSHVERFTSFGGCAVVVTELRNNGRLILVVGMV
jgi:hypothetical protein